MLAERSPSRRSPTVKLGVLELGLRAPGVSSARAMEDAVTLATAADSLGYGRWWGMETHAGATALPRPELAIPLVAARTKRMRVGACLLSRYVSPLQVGEVFRLLEGMHPGRIDLALAPTLQAPAEVALALVSGRVGELREERATERFTDVNAFCKGGHPYGHPLSGVRPSPRSPDPPEMWAMTDDAAAMTRAARENLGLVVPYHLLPEDRREDLPALAETVKRAYADAFLPSPAWMSPRVALTVTVACGETRDEAEGSAARSLAVPGRATLRPDVVGTGEECRKELARLARALGAKEVLVASVDADPAARRAALATLAQAVGLRAVA